MLLAFTTVSAVLGKSTLRGMTALFIGLAAGCVGLDQISGQARYTGGVPNCSTASNRAGGGRPVRRGRGALRVLYEGKVVEAQNKLSRVHMTARDWKRSMPGLAARHRDRHALRLHPGRRHRDPDLPELRDRKEAGQGGCQGRVRHQRRHRRRGRPRGRQQRDRHGGADPLLTLGIPTSNTTAILLGAFQNYGISRAAAVHHLGRAGLGADRLALHRQRDAAGAEPADGRAVGEAAEDSRSRSSTRAS